TLPPLSLPRQRIQLHKILDNKIFHSLRPVLIDHLFQKLSDDRLIILSSRHIFLFPLAPKSPDAAYAIPTSTTSYSMGRIPATREGRVHPANRGLVRSGQNITGNSPAS